MNSQVTARPFTIGIGLNDEQVEPDRRILGGKGAGLVEMVAMGLPVPPGFVINTEAGRSFLNERKLPDTLLFEVDDRIATLEKLTGRHFGSETDPLLVSVRSGAPVSMPGMMDTVLNVGLTWAGAEAMAARTGDSRFAWTSLERLLDAFARTVRGIGAVVLEEALLDVSHQPAEGASARARCAAILALIEAESGTSFPDAQGQLRESIEAVFRSWQSPRARAYRAHKGISDDLGTAVVVQCMVFGNRDASSGSGVAFTRDPSTGARGAYGDFLFLAQGEDVVSGERDTEPLTAVADRLPEIAEQLTQALDALERQTRDLCDVEFTIESSRLYVLQTRVGQRSGRAAVRLAVDLVDEGLISEQEAVARVSDEQLDVANRDRFLGEPEPGAVLAQGVAASPGAVVGLAVFDADRARQMADRGEQVVLFRPTTSPVDLPGVLAAKGVVTGRGGRTSHAAVVARGLDRPAVCGVGDVRISADATAATVNGRQLCEGEVVSVDGDHGMVTLGRRPWRPAVEDDPYLARFLQWRSANTPLSDIARGDDR